MTIRSMLRNWFFKEEPKQSAYEPPDLSEIDGSRMRETLRKVVVSNEVAEAIRATSLGVPDAESKPAWAFAAERPLEETVGTPVPTWRKPPVVITHSKPDIINLDKADTILKKQVAAIEPKRPLGIRIVIIRTDETGKDVRTVADIRNEEDLKSFNCNMKGYAVYVKRE